MIEFCVAIEYDDTVRADEDGRMSVTGKPKVNC